MDAMVKQDIDEEAVDTSDSYEPSLKVSISYLPA